MKVTKNKNHKIGFPQFCDFSCKYADFAGKDLIGDCRKELAVYCKYFKKYNNKNNNCFGIKK